MNNIISFLWLSLLRFLWLVHWYISNKQDMKKNWFLILNSCYRYSGSRLMWSLWSSRKLITLTEW
jgi:hypothetical protein